MKKRFLSIFMCVSLLFSCGGSTNETAIDMGLSAEANSEDILEVMQSFQDGEATNGEEYFSGLLAVVIGVDIKFREINRLDELDVREQDILLALEELEEKLKDGRKSIDIYKNKNWPLRAEFHDLTTEWFDAIEGLAVNYLYDLAEPMSRPDETWEADEFVLFENYMEAREAYQKIDNRWITFQEVYADANNFTIEGTIDEESMVEEQVNQN